MSRVVSSSKLSDASINTGAFAGLFSNTGFVAKRAFHSVQMLQV